MLVIIKKWYSSSDMASLAIHVYINIFSISNIMSSFVITPGNIDDINFVIKDIKNLVLINLIINILYFFFYFHFYIFLRIVNSWFLFAFKL